MDRPTRFRGALLGLATGDALGTTLEFRDPGSFTPLTDLIGGGPFHLNAGEWTDDTSMALCLAESLITCRGFNAKHQLETYVRWYREGHLSSNGRCFDIGITTARSLNTFMSTGNSASGSTNPNAAGNGSIMRLVPVPMFFARDLAQAIHYSGESSRPTHGAATCVEGCRYFGGLLAAALNGVPKEQLLHGDVEELQREWAKAPFATAIADVASGSFWRKEPPEIAGTGYVVKSLEAALWAFAKTDNFRDGALLAVNLGDDADTTGAVYGQIAGAVYGEDGIPPEWRAKIVLREQIRSWANTLEQLAYQ